MFGQVVIGPPGSGKSTYTRGMKEFLEKALGRQVCIINLDVANSEFVDSSQDINCEDLITLDDVMKEMNLGPNGGLVYCIGLPFCLVHFKKQTNPIYRIHPGKYIMAHQ